MADKKTHTRLEKVYVICTAYYEWALILLIMITILFEWLTGNNFIFVFGIYYLPLPPSPVGAELNIKKQPGVVYRLNFSCGAAATHIMDSLLQL